MNAIYGFTVTSIKEKKKLKIVNLIELKDYRYTSIIYLIYKNLNVKLFTSFLKITM